MTGYVKLAAALGVILASFGAGWYVNGERMSNKLKTEQNTTLTNNLQRANTQIGQISDKLGDVVTKSQMAADNTQAAVNAVADIRKAANMSIEGITQDTRRLDNEISALGIPKCTIDFTTGKLWREAGERANSGRLTLYGTESKPKD